MGLYCGPSGTRYTYMGLYCGPGRTRCTYMGLYCGPGGTRCTYMGLYCGTVGLDHLLPLLLLQKSSLMVLHHLHVVVRQDSLGTSLYHTGTVRGEGEKIIKNLDEIMSLNI